jgi:general stress protein YciG
VGPLTDVAFSGQNSTVSFHALCSNLARPLKYLTVFLLSPDAERASAVGSEPGDWHGASGALVTKPLWSRRLNVTVPERKERRGFASMSPERQREIASKGGRAAHEKGTAHEWTPEEARRAGRKGGQVSRGGRGRLDESMVPSEFPSIAPTFTTSDASQQ